MTSYRNTHVISFSEAVGDFRSGQQTPRRLLERCLERIEAREGEVKAFVSLNVKGARAAADASSARYRAGSPLSAIDGCPISVKDIMDTHDMPTQMGSPIYKDWRPRVDAVCVQALRSGGAVILGKTVTTEFACGAVGPTVNPHDPARTPGGSSSGSAAAVGAGMVPVALGTQTQGSTLRPASYCGVVGFKPTHGILPMAGIHPISPTHDHLGVIAGTLKDTWRAASHIALMAQDPKRDFARGKMADLPSPVRPSRLIRFYTKGWEETAAETRAAFDALVSKVERAGVEVVSRINNARVADLEKILDEGFIEHSLDITAYEMKWPYEQYVGRYEELIAKRIRDRIAKARCMTAEYYQHLLVEKETIRQQLSEVLKGADGIITLAASGPAPLGLDSTGSRTFLTYATFLGLPAFSLPLMAIDNLPLGLQIIGDRGRDSALCSLAGWLMREIVYA